MKPRPLSEWHEEIGDVLWWKFPITEAPYVGSPLDCGFSIKLEMRIGTSEGIEHTPSIRTFDVGGWPGYHTHWTPIEMPEAPDV